MLKLLVLFLVPRGAGMSAPHPFPLSRARNRYRGNITSRIYFFYWPRGTRGPAGSVGKREALGKASALWRVLVRHLFIRVEIINGEARRQCAREWAGGGSRGRRRSVGERRRLFVSRGFTPFRGIFSGTSRSRRQCEGNPFH